MVQFEMAANLGPFPVLWEQDGDEWLQRLRVGLSSYDPELMIAGEKFDDTTRPFIEIRAVKNDGLELGSLFVLPLIDNSIVAFVGISRSDEAAIEAWKHATAYATENLGEEGESHRWTSVVGAPNFRVGGTEVALAESGRVGPFVMKPADHAMYEASFSTMSPSLHGWQTNASIPILVEGVHRGYSWQNASVTAARQLNLLCALLSVAWGSCIVVRETLAPLDWGRREPSRKLPWQKIEGEEEFIPEPSVMRAVPEWAEDAWGKLSNTASRRLSDALMAHHEGMSAKLAHPSLSLVAFIAAIEAISQLLFREERCSDCRAQLDISAKFRQTLRLVVDESEARELEAAYSPRSLTVHRGRLHGSETTIGSINMSIWSPDAASRFQWDVLRRMERASGRLLERALRGQLPAKVAFRSPS